MVRANPPTSLATAKGHLDLTRQGQHSTKRIRFAIDEPPAADEPLLPDPALACFTCIQAISDAIHSDATGRFPVPSRRGNNYILISVYAGYVHTESLPSRNAASYVAAFKRTREWFKNLGITPSVQRLDNETSAPVERYLHSLGVNIEYVPPHNHRANKAERAIRHWKNHFIAILGTVAPSFPLDL
jgi:hypothetical protein